MERDAPLKSSAEAKSFFCGWSAAFAVCMHRVAALALMGGKCLPRGDGGTSNRRGRATHSFLGEIATPAVLEDNTKEQHV